MTEDLSKDEILNIVNKNRKAVKDGKPTILSIKESTYLDNILVDSIKNVIETGVPWDSPYGKITYDDVIETLDIIKKCSLKE
jgi:hypothetical protein